jgi:TRAP-type C4-dicarboxylate transport system substrate-binding protein
MRTRKVFLGTAVLLAISCFFVSSLSAAPVELVFNHFVPSVGIIGEQYQKLGSMIEKNTGGRVKIKFYWANALMSPKETLPGIASGVADIGIASGAYDPAKLPGMQILEHAYNASDIWVGVRATNRLFQTMPVLQQQLNRNGVTWVAPYTSGTFQFFLKDKWNSPADFKGKVVRSMGGARALWYEKLGAKPLGRGGPSGEWKIPSAWPTILNIMRL